MAILEEINFMALYYGLFLGFVFTFPAYLITTAVTGSRKRNEDAVLKAMSRGHVVTAVYKKHLSSSVPVPGSKGHKTSSALYEYQYKGKTYHYKHYNDDLPGTLRLYFLRNPRKATVRGNLTDSEVNWFLVYLVVAGCMWCLLAISGFEI